jgi:uncharacterized protein (DUF3084 family)
LAKQTETYTVESADVAIAKLDEQISKHGEVIASRREKIQELNSEKDKLLQVREGLVRLNGMSGEQLAALAQHLQGAGGIESQAKVGDD